MEAGTALIFDGHNAAWRVFHAVPELTVKDQPIQVVFGVLKLIRTALEKFEPETALVCWDSGRPILRRSIYDRYKADREYRRNSEEGRREAADSIERQLILVKSVLKKMAVCQFEIPNVEADDLMAMACATLDGQKTIVSSDRDMLQLVSPDVSVWSPKKLQLYTGKNFAGLFEGLTPRQYLETRVITGDKTDGIPGIARGLGEVTAFEVIKRYGSIGKIYHSKSIRKKLESKGNRYQLFFAEGAEEAIVRNMKLTDLSLVKSETATNLLRTEMKKPRKVDKVYVKKYFLRRKFYTLLQDFASWIEPFQDLEA
jgi:DNA polymerase-1